MSTRWSQPLWRRFRSQRLACAASALPRPASRTPVAEFRAAQLREPRICVASLDQMSPRARAGEILSSTPRALFVPVGARNRCLPGERGGLGQTDWPAPQAALLASAGPHGGSPGITQPIDPARGDQRPRGAGVSVPVLDAPALVKRAPAANSQPPVGPWQPTSTAFQTHNYLRPCASCRSRRRGSTIARARCIASSKVRSHWRKL